MLNDKDAVNGWATYSPQSEARLSTAIAVLGPNASGKTSLLQPLAFLAWFVRSSFAFDPNGGVPVTPHFSRANEACEFEIVADAPDSETLLRYRLRATPQHIVSESLEQRLRRGNWHSLFERQLDNNGKYVIRQSEFGLDQQQAEQVRKNVSLISWAAQFGVEYARQLVTFVFQTNLTIQGRLWVDKGNTLWATQVFSENQKLQLQMKQLLARWDLGLSDVTFHEVTLQAQPGESRKSWTATGVHRDKEQLHLLPFDYESSGTKTAYTLLAIFLPVLEAGGVIVFDELESDLHPHMIEPLLDLFSNEDTNPQRAQIIFSCHSPEVLRFLQKSQVMLVEKDGLDSQAWRLDSMEGVRSDENRVTKYLSGAYGAVPRL